MQSLCSFDAAFEPFSHWSYKKLFKVDRMKMENVILHNRWRMWVGDDGS